METGRLKYLVKSIIDEVTPSSSTIDYNKLPIDERIEVFVESCAKQSVLLSPHKCLEKKEIPGDISGYGDGSGYIVLPEDFLRLFSFRMKGWKQRVIDTVAEESEMYLLQKNPVTRGGLNFPVCAIVKGSDSLLLEWYSVPAYITNPECVEKYYVSSPKITGTEIDIPEQLDMLLAYLTAKEVLMSFQSYDVAKATEELIQKELTRLSM